MVPFPPSIAPTTPEVPCAASPPGTGQSPETSKVHTSGAVAARYSAKFSVVPDSSERLTGVMARSGSSASGLSSAIAGSFQLVISPAKMPAMTWGVRFSESTPSRLKATAMGET